MEGEENRGVKSILLSRIQTREKRWAGDTREGQSQKDWESGEACMGNREKEICRRLGKEDLLRKEKCESLVGTMMEFEAEIWM